jgi:protein arginine kinase activator
VNGNKVEMYLCEQCAKEKGQFSFGSPFGFNDFFPAIMELNQGPSYSAVKSNVQVCEKCGMSYEEFQRVGKLGCSNCYTLFGELLKPLLKRLHGNTQHSGKVPENVSRNINTSKEIEALQELLNKAVQREEYEKAAEIRDKIRALERDKGK